MLLQILHTTFLFPDNLINQFHLSLNQELILYHMNYLKTALLMCIVNYTQSMSNLTGQVKLSYLPYLEKYSTIKWHGKMLTSTLTKKCEELLCVSLSSFPFYYYCLFCVTRARNARRGTVHFITYYSLTW